MSSEVEPRDLHLAAIEAVRVGQKAEAIELVDQLLTWLNGWEQPCGELLGIYRDLRTQLVDDHANLPEIHDRMVEALARIDQVIETGQLGIVNLLQAICTAGQADPQVVSAGDPALN